MSQSIFTTLRQIGNGDLVTTAENQLTELVKAVTETGKAGCIDIKISVKKATRGGAMHITGKTKLTPPAKDPMEVMLFATEDGELTADNPKQQKIDLRVPEINSYNEPKTINTGE